MPSRARAGGAVDASHPAYQKRLARAKTTNSSSTELGQRAPSQFSLDLSGLSASLGAPPAEGDHKLGAGDQGILTTPRADQEVAITVRGAPKLALLSKAARPLAEARGVALLLRCHTARGWRPNWIYALRAHASLAVAGTSSASSSSWGPMF